MINVAKVISSSSFRQTFNVYRTSGEYGPGGWVKGPEQAITVEGIVHPTTAKDLEQLPEADRVTESMTFFTTTAVYTTRGDAPAGVSDEIEYQGKRYRLVPVKDYLVYGYNKAIGVRKQGD